MEARQALRGSRRWFVVAALAFCACKTDPGAPELVGEWQTSTADRDGQVYASISTYDFKGDGSFAMSRDGVLPMTLTGKWRVSERSGRKLRLRFADQTAVVPGSSRGRWKDREGWAELAQGARAFTFDAEVFKRIEPKP
jgi:hypothetical protein